MNNKQKLIASILLACIGSFTIGMYVAHTRFNIDDHWSPNGHIEMYRWVTTSIVTLGWIFYAYSIGGKNKL